MIGSTLGRYRIIEKLGAGAMGVVYRAHDDRLQRDVALKVIAPDAFGDETAQKRFRREALALSKLSHPNLATVYDFDSEGGTDFLAMEYIAGATLSHTLTAGPLPDKDVAALGAQIASALQEAHDNHVVHRDLKPANIMLTPKGQVKVLDFGLAKLQRPVGPSSTTQSSGGTHGVAGTLPYMAPEQLRGAEVDARTDIHAVGAVLYEMSTGRPPYQGGTAPMLADAILHQAPVPPRAANPAVSPALEPIILKCLEKDPENRYQPAKELIVDLRRAGTGLVVAGPAAPAGQARTRAKRSKILIATGTIVLACGSALLWRLASTQGLTEKDVVLITDLENRTGDPLFDGTMLKDALALKLMESPFLNLYPPEEVREALRLMERPADTRIDEQLGREICVRQGLKALVTGTLASLGRTYVIQLKAVEGQSRGTLAIEQVEARSREEVVRQLGKAATNLRKRLGESLASVQKFDVPLEQATTSSLEALQAFSAAIHLRAKGQFVEALAQCKRATEIDPDFALAYAELADLYGDDNRTDLMRAAATTAYRLRRRASERERLSIEFTYYASVTEDIRRVLEVAALQAQLHPRDWSAHNNLGLYCRTLGRYDEAIEHFQEVLRLSPQSAGHGHANLAWTYQFLNRFDEAQAHADRAIAAGYDSVGVRQLLYTLAGMRGDTAGMEAQVHELGGDQQEYLAEHWQGDHAAFLGQVTRARGFYENAARLAEQRGLTNRIAIELARAAAIEAQVGLCGDIQTKTARALTLSREVSVLRDAAGALAQCGRNDEAEALVFELARNNPQSTYVNEFLLPDLRALVQLQRGHNRQVVDLLQPVVRYNRTASGVRAMYRRGLALLALGDGKAAAAEFQAILDNRGLDAFSIYYPLAHLQLGRVAALERDTTKARKSYERFFELWKDADPGLPLLQEARAAAARGL